MHPAFPRRSAAAGFLALMLLFLLMPLLFLLLPPPSILQHYRGITREAGRFAYMGDQIAAETSPIDILFFGFSLLRASIDETLVQQRLEASLGRPITVRKFGVNWEGLDIQYILLRDLLARRKVNTIVLSMPAAQHTSARPHVQLHRLIQPRDLAPLSAGLPLRHRLALYAATVLGAPRQLLNFVRPNRIGPEETAFLLEENRIGFYGAPFVERRLDPPAIPSGRLIHNPASSSPDWFRFTGQPHNSYQRHFLFAIVNLLQQHRVQLVILHVPQANEFGSDTVPERERWSSLLPGPVALAGIPARVLFAGFTRQQMHEFYYDEHLNRNGRQLFTGAMIPAFQTIYANSAAH